MSGRLVCVQPSQRPVGLLAVENLLFKKRLRQPIQRFHILRNQPLCPLKQFSQQRPALRAAVARALITNPKIILADEPTGALDSRATDELLRLFSEINQSGQTILMVTHSVKAASHAGRVLFIKDGEVFHQIYRGDATNEQLYQKISDTLTMLTTGGDRA